MYKTYFIDTFNNDGNVLEDLEKLGQEEFKAQAESMEFAEDEFDQAFDSALDSAYMNGLALLENTETGQVYQIDKDSDEYQILQLSRNHKGVDFKDVIQGVNEDSKKFAKAFLDDTF